MNEAGRRHYSGTMLWGSDAGRSGRRERVALLREMVDRHAAALELYARHWCHDAEDVVQECLVKLASIRRLPDDPVAWLYRAVRNRAITASRAARRRIKHECIAAEPRRPWFVRNNGQQLDASAAAEALESVAPDQREVVVMHLSGGLTFEQIGRLTGCSPSTAHRRYLVALESLRQKLRLP